MIPATLLTPPWLTVNPKKVLETKNVDETITDETAKGETPETEERELVIIGAIVAEIETTPDDDLDKMISDELADVQTAQIAIVEGLVVDLDQNLRSTVGKLRRFDVLIGDDHQVDPIHETEPYSFWLPSELSSRYCLITSSRKLLAAGRSSLTKGTYPSPYSISYSIR